MLFLECQNTDILVLLRPLFCLSEQTETWLSTSSVENPFKENLTQWPHTMAVEKACMAMGDFQKAAPGQQPDAA